MGASGVPAWCPTFPILPCAVLNEPGETDCACVSRRGNGIMASRYSYGRGTRGGKMPVFMLLVSPIICFCLFRASCDPLSFAGIRLCIYMCHASGSNESTSLRWSLARLPAREAKFTAFDLTWGRKDANNRQVMCEEDCVLLWRSRSHWCVRDRRRCAILTKAEYRTNGLHDPSASSSGF